MKLPILNVENAKSESLGLITRHVLFSPSLNNSRYMRMAVVVGQPTARSAAHTHAGNEAIYTKQGEIVLTMGGHEYRVGAGQAIMVPPDTLHQAAVTSDAPWVSVCFYCDECPVLETYRASGGMLREEQPRVVGEDDGLAEQLGQLSRRILLTPARDGVNFLRLATAEGPAGAKSPVHVHLGNECFFTLEGQAALEIEGEMHLVDEDHAMAIPPGTGHPLTVRSENWKAIAAYCDECPILKS